MIHVRKKYERSGKFMEGSGWKGGIAIYLEARVFQYECRNQKADASFSFLSLPFLLLPFFSLTTELSDNGLSSITGPSDPDSASEGIYLPCVAVPGRGWSVGGGELSSILQSPPPPQSDIWIKHCLYWKSLYIKSQ